MHKTTRALAAGILTGCLLTTGTVCGAEPSDVQKIQILKGGDISPYSTLFRSGTINLTAANGIMSVSVTTKASQIVNHIYHDVTIYKNGSWYSSDRYEEWSVSKLNTCINVPVQSGDTIEVYVDHYTEHGGLTESASTSKTKSY